MKRLIIGISGASGAVYGIRLLELLRDTPGVEPHLVDTIDKDVLQRNPGIPWSKVAGLKDAKATLQEAAVLPLIMPEFFKVSRTFGLILSFPVCLWDRNSNLVMPLIILFRISLIRINNFISYVVNSN